MTEIPSRDTQLDRVEGKLDQVLDRLTRMEERQASQGAQLDSHAMQLADHSQRLREVELAHAVSKATTTQQGQRLFGRWAAVGAVGLVVIGTVGSVIGKLLTDMLGGS